MSASVTTTVERGVNPRDLVGAGAEAGILTGSASGEGGASLVEIAIWNEFGTERTDSDGRKVPHIPPRPFLRSASEEKRRDWRKIVKRVTRLMLRGKITRADAEGILGAQMQSDIQETLIALRDPPNAPRTIRAKGSSNPLIDTGSLKDAIKWQSFGGE